MTIHDLKLRDEVPVTIKEEVEVRVKRNLKAKLWVSILTGFIGAIVSFLLLVKEVVGVIPRLREIAFINVGISATLVIVLTLTTAALARLRRGPSKIARLKGQVASAYIGALESSQLNPAIPRSKHHGGAAG